jgi:hypothetical protein
MDVRQEGLLMTKFSEVMVTERVQRFWAAMARGEFITDAAAEAGTYCKKGARWLVAAGGVRPRRGRDLKGRCLMFAEREEIAVGRARTAHALAYERAGRPKPSKLAINFALRRQVQEDLHKRYSPEQIAGRLCRQFPDDPQMRDWKQVSVAADIEIFFCDPHAPWQRATNERGCMPVCRDRPAERLGCDRLGLQRPAGLSGKSRKPLDASDRACDGGGECRFHAFCWYLAVLEPPAPHLFAGADN